MYFQSPCPGLFRRHVEALNSQSSSPDPRNPANPGPSYPPRLPDVPASLVNAIAPAVNGVALSDAPKAPAAHRRPERRNVHHGNGKEKEVDMYKQQNIWHKHSSTAPHVFPGTVHDDSIAGKCLNAFVCQYKPQGFPMPDNPMLFFQNIIPIGTHPRALRCPVSIKYSPGPKKPASEEERVQIESHFARARFFQNRYNVQKTVAMLALARTYAEDVCRWWFRMILFREGYRCFGMPYEDKSPIVPDNFPQCFLDVIAEKGLWECVLYCTNLEELLYALAWSNYKEQDDSGIKRITAHLNELALHLGRFRSSNRRLVFQACEALSADMKLWQQSQSCVNAAWQPICELKAIKEFCKLLKEFDSVDDWEGAWKDIIELHTKLTVDQIAMGIKSPTLNEVQIAREEAEKVE